MRKKSRTAAEQRHHDRVAALGCVLCELLGQQQAGRTTVHHIRTGQGMSQRASHWLVVPLCGYCHQGEQGVHGDQTLLRMAKVSELDLLAITISRLEVAA